MAESSFPFHMYPLILHINSADNQITPNQLPGIHTKLILRIVYSSLLYVRPLRVSLPSKQNP